MGKSQARRLEQTSMNFRKELRSCGCVARTEAEVARDAIMKRLLGDDYIPPRSKVTNKIANYGENKSQSKGARSTKRFGRKQMA